MKNVVNKMMFLVAFFCLSVFTVKAQDSTEDNTQTTPTPTVSSSESHLLVAGLFTTGFMTQSQTNNIAGLKTTDKTNSMGDADRFEFSPMFLWRHGDKLLLEFEPSFDGSSLGVNWADVSYYFAPGLIVRAGYLVLPFGTYTKRLGAGWINKLASDPIGTDIGGTDFGVEVEGGLPLGSMKWSYDISLTNGFQLGNDGTISGVGIQALNNGKTLCGRLALLPFSNSSLEIGVSGLTGAIANADGYTYSNLNPTDKNGPNTNMYAIDLNFVKNIKPIQINIKAQYSNSMISDLNYMNPNDSTQTFTFNNKTNAFFGQVAVRPISSKNNILKNLELAYRYVNYKTPENSTWGQNYSEHNVALDYWLSWRTVVKLAYENIKSDGTSSVPITGIQGTNTTSRMIVQFSTEF